MNLTIDIDAEYECGWAWSVPAIGSLKEFKKLYEVQTAGPVLFPEIEIKYPGNKRSPHPVSFYKDLLPSSLERIIFTSMSPSTQAHILALGIFASDLKSDTCPELELVKLTTDEWATCEGPEERDTEEEEFMHEGFRAAGVRFKSAPYVRAGYDPWGDEAMREYQSSL
ncbi:hypothetical protein K7432_007751 [Basidiobolus ranarum]|uniref:Uncharacterized protein n=1 Tax=Basidiobolus ranarum TaxID=34480 RepID=A0ABR2WSX2_9FUNG